MGESLHSLGARFRNHRTTLRLLEPADADAALRAEASFAVGLLIGGGFPGAAAAMSIVVERLYPDEEVQWIWSERDDAGHRS